MVSNRMESGHVVAGPSHLDVTTPNIARIYDYWLGGKDHFAADREAAEKVMAISSNPGVVRDVQEQRAFSGRAVRHAARGGIRQFLDLGTGLPTRENVHESARRVIPDAKVVYIDHDPVVCVHGLALLADSTGVEFVRADIRRPEDLLSDSKVAETIDFAEPVALVLTGILHHITHAEDPYEIVARLTEPLAPGSHLILSHLSSEPSPDRVARAAGVFDGATAGLIPRSRAEILGFFDSLELLDPGLVNLPAWRPEVQLTVNPEIYATLAGVGRKPGRS